MLCPQRCRETKWSCTALLGCHCCVSPAAPGPACSASGERCILRWGCILPQFCGDFFSSESHQDVSVSHLHLECFTAAPINRGSASTDWSWRKDFFSPLSTQLYDVLLSVFQNSIGLLLLPFWGWAGCGHHGQLLSSCWSFSLLSHSVAVIHITLVILDRLFFLLPFFFKIPYLWGYFNSIFVALFSFTVLDDSSGVFFVSSYPLQGINEVMKCKQ